MWDDVKQQEFDTLRQREWSNALSEPESQRLAALYAELDEEEARSLAPAMLRYDEEAERLHAEIDRIRQGNAALQALEQRQDKFLAKARRQLATLLREKAAIDAEYQRIGLPAGFRREEAR